MQVINNTGVRVWRNGCCVAEFKAGKRLSPAKKKRSNIGIPGSIKNWKQTWPSEVQDVRQDLTAYLPFLSTKRSPLFLVCLSSRSLLQIQQPNTQRCFHNVEFWLSEKTIQMVGQYNVVLWVFMQEEHYLCSRGITYLATTRRILCHRIQETTTKAWARIYWKWRVVPNVSTAAKYPMIKRHGQYCCRVYNFRKLREA